MFILFLFILLGCNKEKSFYNIDVTRSKAIFSNQDITDNLEDYEESEEEETEEEPETDTEQEEDEVDDYQEEEVDLFQLIKDNRVNDLVDQIYTIHDIDTLEKENEDGNTFLHVLIENEESDEFNEMHLLLIKVIRALKYKIGFNWNKKGKEGSYVFLAFKCKLFYVLYEIIEDGFKINEEDIYPFINLAIEKSYPCEHICFRLFFGRVLLERTGSIVRLLKEKLDLYKGNREKEEYILNLLKLFNEKVSTQYYEQLEEI